MALPAVADAFYPTQSEILAQILADVRYYALTKYAVEVNVQPGSDVYIRCNAVTRRLSVLVANNRIASSNFSPRTAEGDQLLELAAQFGIFPRPASSASGSLIVELTGVATATIPPGFLAVAPNGSTYAVTTGGIFASGDLVAVSAVETGEDTNQDPSTRLQWADAGIGGLVQTCAVGPSGITGGAESDDVEDVRTRLLRSLAAPAVGGNWSSIAGWAEASSAAIETAFVYPAVQGPGSYDVAVVGFGDNKALDLATIDGAKAAILAEMPGHAELNVTSVIEQGVDVVLDAILPLPVIAGGVGGGWRDSAPWPAAIDGQPAAIFGTPNVTFAAVTKTLTRSAGSWIADRFKVGMSITVTGSASNNTSFTITALTSTVATVLQTPVNETYNSVADGNISSAATVPTFVVSTSAGIIRVSSSASNPPTAGKHFAIYRPDTGAFEHYTAASVSGVAGLYSITVVESTLPTGDLVGCYVSADCEHIEEYLDAFVTQVRALGPGEKSGNPDIIPRGLRHPPPEEEAPVALASALLGKITSAYAEITDLAYGARYAAGGITQRALPSVAAAPANPPNQLVLNQFAIRVA